MGTVTTTEQPRTILFTPTYFIAFRRRPVLVIFIKKSAGFRYPVTNVL